MGLQSQLNDVSSDSIPLLLIAIIANSIRQFRSLLLNFLHSTGLLSPHGSDLHDGYFRSGLPDLIVLAEQRNINSVLSYRYRCGNEKSDCLVCLSTLRDEDRVRKLDCRHVFHKDCLDGWLDHLNFNCPLCRSPLVTDERVATTRQRVDRDLLAWLSFR